mgnify:CR=1 FL=1
MTLSRVLKLLSMGRNMPDFCSFNEIDEVCDIAYEAIKEKINREYPTPLTWDKMKQMNEQPVYVIDLRGEGRTGWYILSWDYRRSGQHLVLSSRYCYGFLSDEYGVSWVAYKHKPEGV